MAKKIEPYKNSEYWENRIAKETWKTYNSAEEKNRDLLRMYEKTSSSIKRELYALSEEAEKNGELTRTQQYRYNKLLGQQGVIFQEIEKLGESIEKVQKSRMKTVGKDVYKNVMESLGIESFSYPNKKEMEQMLRSPWHGSFFSERLWNDMGVLERNMNGVINDFISTGKTVTEAAVQLSNVMQKSFNVAHRLVRTETINYMNRSALRGYKDAGVSKVQWWAAEDERTCEICGTNHETIYDIDKSPILPCHPGCRCTWIPVIEESKIAENEKKMYNNDEEKDSSEVLSLLSKTNIEYNRVKKLTTKLTDSKIIERLGGGDMTIGSCASLSFAYTGNKAGLDVLDYRGGKSTDFFASNRNIRLIAELEGVKTTYKEGYNDVKNAVALLKEMEKDKEFILVTGKHAAIVKHIEQKYFYLELQSESSNGFKKLTERELRYRFGCTKSRTIHGMKLEQKSYLIDVQSLGENKEFEKILGYINTNVDKQMKGAKGHVK